MIIRLSHAGVPGSGLDFSFFFFLETGADGEVVQVVGQVQ